MPKSSPQAAKADTRQRIETAALSLFVAHGILGATTREIAKAAGLSEGALYRHFKSKDEIAQSLFDFMHAQLAEVVRTAGKNDGDLFAKTDAIVEAYCKAADEDWLLFSFHLLSIGKLTPSSTATDDPVTACEEIIAAAAKSSELKPTNEKLLAAVCLGVVLQPALHLAHGRTNGKLGDHCTEFKTAIRAILTSYKSTA